MNVKLIKLTKEYYLQLSEMIDEWKKDIEENDTNSSPNAILKKRRSIGKRIYRR